MVKNMCMIKLIIIKSDKQEKQVLVQLISDCLVNVLLEDHVHLRVHLRVTSITYFKQ